MNKFKIYRWDSILPEKSENSLPMVYIRANMSLLKFAQKNDYILNVRIGGTDTVYDGPIMKGTFDSLVLGPNCKLPAFKDKEFHTVCLESYFFEYPQPSKMGYIEILGIPEKKVRFSESHLKDNSGNDLQLRDDDIQEDFKEYLTDEIPNTLQGSKSSSVGQLILLSLILLFVSILLFIIFKKRGIK